MTKPITPPTEPAPPTDEEIMELMPQQMRDDLANAARALAGFDRANVKAAGAMRIILNRHAVDHARAVLARWGAQYGADQELEACCKWVDWKWSGVKSRELRAARRPKPPSLNSIALQMLGTIERDAHYIPEITDTIRRALEALDD